MPEPKTMNDQDIINKIYTTMKAAGMVEEAEVYLSNVTLGMMVIIGDPNKMPVSASGMLMSRYAWARSPISSDFWARIHNRLEEYEGGQL